jgi:CMP-N-acetylneuraminic acid synthetase
LLDGKVSAVNIPPERAIDIDNETDFFIAEALLKREINDKK